jgi:sugar O-acyltransferase (sialic acid O-acetyltransferase NeuD family)
MKNNKLIIFGTSLFAEIAFEYFSRDSFYNPWVFTVEKDYIEKDELFDTRIVPFETIEKVYPPDHYSMFVAVGYGEKCSIKERIYNEAKKKGYELVNYVSSKAFMWRNVKLGDNNFIFEDNTIQPFVTIGNNNTFWSGNHIGHHSSIGNHNFFSSHIVVCGRVEIGDKCFFGVNSSIEDQISIPDNTYLKMGAIATRSYIYEMGKKRAYIRS